MTRLNNYMKQVRLNVTKAHIKNGQPVNPSKCPIANSIMENIKNAYFVSVLPDQVAIKIKNGNKVSAYKSITPKLANTFIKRFDDGKRVGPFSLELMFEKVDKNSPEFV